MKIKQNQEKGITLIALIITIIVLSIILSIGVSMGKNVLKSSEFTAFTTELKIMQTKVNEWNQAYKNNDKLVIDGENYIGAGNTQTGEKGIQEIGEDLTSESQQILNSTEVNEILSKKAEGNQTRLTEIKDGFRLLTQSYLTEKLKVENITNDYLVNVKERIVVCTYGFEYENVVYYMLEQIDNGLYNVDYKDQNNKEGDFTVKTTKVGDEWQIEVSNIQHEKYVSKWQVKYQKEGSDIWNTSDSLIFNVPEGIYQVKVVHGNEIELGPYKVIAMKDLWTGKVNKPNLEEGMIPIKYKNSNWVICAEDDPEWYDYKNQASGEYGTSKWANVMLSDGTYKTSLNNYTTDGTTIVAEAELGSMFVWIPRFAYCIQSGYHTSNAGTIKVEFLKWNTNQSNSEIQIDNELGQGKWNVHPAFNYGDKKLQGFWVAKFEASSTTTTPDEDYGGGNVTNLNVKVLPGKQSWRNITVSNSYTNCINMNNETNASYYGVTTDKNRLDPHLMKNSEWGAVAYLTQSSYGRNGVEVTPNSYGWDLGKYIYTGYAGNSTDAGNKWESTSKPTNVFYYNTPQGVLASTTANETGIYDLSGGTWERVAAYIDNGNPNLGKGSALINSTVVAHKDVYVSNEDSTLDVVINAQRNYDRLTTYGDSLWEISTRGTGNSSWNGDYSVFPAGDDPFFTRGCAYFYCGFAGVFSFSVLNGEGNIHSFRPTLAVF